VLVALEEEDCIQEVGLVEPLAVEVVLVEWVEVLDQVEVEEALA
jgi:hypothetical protein